MMSITYGKNVITFTSGNVKTYVAGESTWIPCNTGITRVFTGGTMYPVSKSLICYDHDNAFDHERYLIEQREDWSRYIGFMMDIDRDEEKENEDIIERLNYILKSKKRTNFLENLFIYYAHRIQSERFIFMPFYSNL